MEDTKQKKKRSFKFPLWAKTLVVLLLSVSAISVVAVVYASNYLRKTTLNSYISRATEIADTMSVYFNYDDIVSVKTKTLQIYSSLSEDKLVSNEAWGEEEWVTYYHH